MKVQNKKKQKKNKKKTIYIIFITIILTSILLLLSFSTVEVKEYTPEKSYSKTKDYQTVAKKESDIQSDFKNNKFQNGSSLYFEDKNTGVILPIYIVPENDMEKQNKMLQKGMISQNHYNQPGENNFVIFGHNDYYGNYLTPEIETLQVGQEINIYEKENNTTVKYTYEITEKKVVDKNNISSVYYKSEKPIIHIGTCEKWYKTNKRLIWTGKLVNETTSVK